MPLSTISTSTITHTSTDQRIPITPAELFRKNVRRDPSLFPILKNDALHTTWTSNIQITGKTQLVDNVFNNTYISTIGKKLLFYL